MTDIAYETIYFFLALIAAGAIFTILWAGLHWFGFLRRADDWEPGDRPEDWWR